jgi:hypothetical protein
MKTISIADIKAIYNPGEGRHWFDRSTMRFFRTKLPRVGYQADNGDIYFVTSEQFVGSHSIDPRRYTVRKLIGQGDIQTIGEFNTIPTIGEATQAAKMYALGPKEQSE